MSHISNLVFIVFLIVFALRSLSANNYDTVLHYNPADSNIVAAVVGYQKLRHHESGVDIPSFSIAPGAGDGTESSILFYILAPTNHAGKFFLINCCRNEQPWENGQIPGERLFRRDNLYSFKQSDLISADISNSFGNARPLYTTKFFDTRPFFWSKQEAESYISEKKETKKRLEALLVKFADKRKTEEQELLKKGIVGFKGIFNNETKAYREYAKEWADVRKSIETISRELTDANERLLFLRNSGAK